MADAAPKSQHDACPWPPSTAAGQAFQSEFQAQAIGQGAVFRKSLINLAVARQLAARGASLHPPLDECQAGALDAQLRKQMR